MSEANPPRLDNLHYVEGVVQSVESIGKHRNSIRVELVGKAKAFQYSSTSGPLKEFKNRVLEGASVKFGYSEPHKVRGLFDSKGYYIVYSVSDINGWSIGHELISEKRMKNSRSTLALTVFMGCCVIGILFLFRRINA